MKHTIRLTESELKRYIVETAKRCINEIGDTHRGQFAINAVAGRARKNGDDDKETNAILYGIKNNKAMQLKRKIDDLINDLYNLDTISEEDKEQLRQASSIISNVCGNYWVGDAVKGISYGVNR